MINTIITPDQVVADFGAYYKDSGQGEQNLHMLPFESFETKNAFTIVPTEDTVLDDSNVEVGEILQAYQDDFTPKGSVVFSPNRIILQKMKIDQNFNPHRLQVSWLGFLTSTNTDATTWPFVRWFAEMYLMKQWQDDMEMKVMYKGIKTIPVAGVAGAAENVMDGIEKLIADAVTAGATPITLGAVAATDEEWVKQVELFVSTIPEKYRYMPMELNMNRTLRDKYKRGVRSSYKSNYDPTDVKNYRVTDAENITIVGRPSMAGKDKIWCTPKYNAIMGVKGFANTNSFEIEKAKREVAIYTEWFTGIGFIQPKLVFFSDQV